MRKKRQGEVRKIVMIVENDPIAHNVAIYVLKEDYINGKKISSVPDI